MTKIIGFVLPQHHHIRNIHALRHAVVGSLAASRADMLVVPSIIPFLSRFFLSVLSVFHSSDLVSVICMRHIRMYIHI